MNDKDFDTMIKEIHDERVAYERHSRKLAQIKGENIYTLFCIWCNAFRNGEGKTNPNEFALFLKTENIGITPTQRRYLAEKYFGYKYEYKHDKGKWEIKMV